MAETGTKLIYDNVPAATRLLEQRRQMYNVQDALEKEKERYAQKQEEFKKREEQLKLQDAQLQSSLVKFSKFLQDNEIKRKKSEQKITEEELIINEKNQEIETLSATLQTYKEGLERVSRVLVKVSQFANIASKSANGSQDINDIISKHKLLMHTYENLMENKREVDGELEANQKLMTSFYKSANDSMAKLEHDNMRLRSILDDLRARHARLERENETYIEKGSGSQHLCSHIYTVSKSILQFISLSRRGASLYATSATNSNGGRATNSASARAVAPSATGGGTSCKLVNIKGMTSKELVETLSPTSPLSPASPVEEGEDAQIAHKVQHTIEIMGDIKKYILDYKEILRTLQHSSHPLSSPLEETVDVANSIGDGALGGKVRRARTSHQNLPPHQKSLPLRNIQSSKNPPDNGSHQNLILSGIHSVDSDVAARKQKKPLTTQPKSLNIDDEISYEYVR